MFLGRDAFTMTWDDFYKSPMFLRALEEHMENTIRRLEAECAEMDYTFSPEFERKMDELIYGGSRPAS